MRLSHYASQIFQILENHLILIFLLRHKEGKGMGPLFFTLQFWKGLLPAQFVLNDIQAHRERQSLPKRTYSLNSQRVRGTRQWKKSYRGTNMTCQDLEQSRELHPDSHPMHWPLPNAFLSCCFLFYLQILQQSIPFPSAKQPLRGISTDRVQCC